MKLRILQLLLFGFLVVTSRQVSATTWDEPWAEEFIAGAESFALCKIISVDQVKGVKVKLVKLIGGKELPAEFDITDFYSLTLTSQTGTLRPEFRLTGSADCYFFLKKGEADYYKIATPTSGFDYLKDGSVYANYRHSFHQSLIPAEVYEKSMSAIFNYYHNLDFEKDSMNAFINLHLSQKPAGFAENELDLFFLQHVAMESIYHLKLQDHYNQLPPFLLDSANFHNRVSAARAMSAYNTTECKELLFQTIAEQKEDDQFVKVICIWSLSKFKPVEMKDRLEELLPDASTAHNGFGAHLMDPRIGTYMPTVKEALEKLISEL